MGQDNLMTGLSKDWPQNSPRWPIYPQPLPASILAGQIISTAGIFRAPIKNCCVGQIHQTLNISPPYFSAGSRQQLRGDGAPGGRTAVGPLASVRVRLSRARVRRAALPWCVQKGTEDWGHDGDGAWRWWAQPGVRDKAKWSTHIRTDVMNVSADSISC